MRVLTDLVAKQNSVSACSAPTPPHSLGQSFLCQLGFLDILRPEGQQREAGRRRGGGRVKAVWLGVQVWQHEGLRTGEGRFQDMTMWVNNTLSVISRDMQINKEMAF